MGGEVGVKWLAGGIAAIALVVCGSATSAVAPRTGDLNPNTFSELSNGVVMIRGFTCSGVPKITGTGFLVGQDVVMTARHVVDPGGTEAKDACRVKVRVDGHWVDVKKQGWWHGTSDPTGRQTDLATLKLSQSASEDDHIFEFLNSSPRVGTNLSMIGYPLGHPIALSQGKLIAKGHLPGGGVPLLEINLLAGQGASGSPIVNDSGYVVGVLQTQLNQGSGVDLFTGNRISTAIFGIDIASWWGSGHKAEKRLCAVYPQGGIPGCGSNGGPSTTGTGSTGSTSSTGSTGGLPPTPWLPPAGYTFWVGAGSYAAATIAYLYDADSCTPAAYSMGCWGVTVTAHDGCDGGLYVKVELLDASQNVVGSGIDSVPMALADDFVLLQSSVFTQGVSQYEITEIDCFNS